MDVAADGRLLLVRGDLRYAIRVLVPVTSPSETRHGLTFRWLRRSRAMAGAWHSATSAERRQ